MSALSPAAAPAIAPAAQRSRVRQLPKGLAAIVAASTYAASGVGFAGASILLARALAPAEYARASLAFTFLFAGFSAAPLGADGVINRHDLPPTAALLRRIASTSMAVAAVVATAAWGGYGLAPAVAALLAFGILSGGLVAGAAAHFQARRRFSASLSLTQSGNIILLVAATVALGFGVRTALVPVALTSLGLAAVAALAWSRLRRDGIPGRASLDRLALATPVRYPWREALSYAGASGAALLMAQLERLTIPQVLSLRDLAVYAVLASFAAAPYRVLQLGVGHTLLPRLRAAALPEERRRILLREALLVGTIGALGGAIIWTATPFAVRLLLAGKYVLPRTLVLAAILAGNIKVMSSLVRVAVTAVCGVRDLTYLGAVGWLSVVVGVLASVVGAPYGIIGVMAGVALGWLTWMTVGLILLRPYLRGATPPQTC